MTKIRMTIFFLFVLSLYTTYAQCEDCCCADDSCHVSKCHTGACSGCCSAHCDDAQCTNNINNCVPTQEPTADTSFPSPAPTICPGANPQPLYTDPAYGYVERSGVPLNDGYCDDEFNIAECNYDGGDCCVETCGENSTDTDLIYTCAMMKDYSDGLGFDCKDPDYAIPTTTTPAPINSMYNYDNVGGTHEAAESDVICINHDHVMNDFIAVGTWDLANEEHSALVKGTDEYAEYCLVNDICSGNVYEGKMGDIKNGKDFMTYCCAFDVWVITGYMEAEGYGCNEGMDCEVPLEFKWVGATKSGDITGLTEWTSVEPISHETMEFLTFSEVSVTQEDCAVTGAYVVLVLAALFILILIYFCFRLGIKNCDSILDAFEKQAGRIELIIIGICFGDSFISSIFITVPVPLTVVSKGIVVLFLSLVSLILFLVRMYVTKAHFLDSESIGSFSDFTFDLGLGCLLVFMYVDPTQRSGSEGMALGFDPAVGILFVMTYAGVIEEFLQLLSVVKNEKVTKAIEWYLDYSGRVLSTINMFVLFTMGIAYVDLSYNSGFAVAIAICSAIMFLTTCYGWFAYVGCCGCCGGHKKNEQTHKKKSDSGDDEEKGRADNTEDVVKDVGDTKADNTANNDAEIVYTKDDATEDNITEEAANAPNVVS